MCDSSPASPLALNPAARSVDSRTSFGQSLVSAQSSTQTQVSTARASTGASGDSNTTTTESSSLSSVDRSRLSRQAAAMLLTAQTGSASWSLMPRSAIMEHAGASSLSVGSTASANPSTLELPPPVPHAPPPPQSGVMRFIDDLPSAPSSFATSTLTGSETSRVLPTYHTTTQSGKSLFVPAHTARRAPSISSLTSATTVSSGTSSSTAGRVSFQYSSTTTPGSNGSAPIINFKSVDPKQLLLEQRKRNAMSTSASNRSSEPTIARPANQDDALSRMDHCELHNDVSGGWFQSSQIALIASEVEVGAVITDSCAPAAEGSGTKEEMQVHADHQSLSAARCTTNVVDQHSRSASSAVLSSAVIEAHGGKEAFIAKMRSVYHPN